MKEEKEERGREGERGKGKKAREGREREEVGRKKHSHIEINMDYISIYNLFVNYQISSNNIF